MPSTCTSTTSPVRSPADFDVIPAIDLLGGACVRLLRGDYDAATEYSRDPTAVAGEFVAAGARRLHVVDLDAARGSADNRVAVESVVAAHPGLRVDVGGGIRDGDAAAHWLELGVAYVVLGTVAIEDPGLTREIAARWPGRVLIGFDTRAGMITTRGWREGTGVPLRDALGLYEDVPVAGVIHTEVERDGALVGLNLAELRLVVAATRHPVVASGGVRDADDIRGARAAGAAGVVVGRALYEGRVDLTVISGLGSGQD